MYIYLLLFILPVIPCTLPYIIRNREVDVEAFKKASILVFFFVLLLLCAFRGRTVGSDTANYFRIYNRFSHWSLKQILAYKEPAFSLLCKGISILTGEYQWLIITASLMSIIPLMILYLEKVEFPMTTIALFMFTSNFYLMFSGMRQAIAISIGIIAFYLTKNKKLIPFIISVALAFLFHRSAIVLSLMYPMYHIRLMKKHLFFIIPVMLAIYFFNNQIFAFLQTIIQDYEGIGNQQSNAYTTMALLILFSLFSYVIPEEDQMDKDSIGLRNFLLLTTAVQLFAPINFLVMRMGYYFLVFLPITVPKLIKASSVRWQLVATAAHAVIFLFFTIHFILTAPSTNALRIFPYHFFWEMV